MYDSTLESAVISFSHDENVLIDNTRFIFIAVLNFNQ